MNKIIKSAVVISLAGAVLVGITPLSTQASLDLSSDKINFDKISAPITGFIKQAINIGQREIRRYAPQNFSLSWFSSPEGFLRLTRDILKSIQWFTDSSLFPIIKKVGDIASKILSVVISLAIQLFSAISSSSVIN